MSAHLSCLEDRDRDKKLQVERVMDILEIKEGPRVADIGAGSGWFTVRAAKRVGNSELSTPSTSIQIRSPISISVSAATAFTTFRGILSVEDDPKLPKNRVDSVLLLKSYHEVAPSRASTGEPARLITDRLQRSALLIAMARAMTTASLVM